MEDLIQKYQALKQRSRQAELNMASAKAQAEVYRKDIESILISEQVDSVEALVEKYNQKCEEFRALLNVLETQTKQAEEVLENLK